MDKKKAPEGELCGQMLIVKNEHLNEMDFSELTSILVNEAKKDLDEESIPYKEVTIAYPVKIHPFIKEQHKGLFFDEGEEYDWCIEYDVMISKKVNTKRNKRDRLKIHKWTRVFK